ncbi:MAG: 16S rRNA (cytidine(1402)-2'-O)-methyltransferase [Candidatus Kerfeldbacteria bacterium CG08_land_8_20_14_0_20_40_16]|uniref:Ribosomal RNA small subunit methyltransferase I n=1 Tax=Candidatus Kerfeldbacteria bacterium CG08_land_8_20_14_0_20_40_16 TaxID=2014244 RepID=A0A2H0YVW3_9BACT|nr:MAG: 16S rRNA (cytidine(1402)-2'-O)-methyltransferase [Candidatus Kerfeldbacteria bacterium CG08_land_8_20_14_0_20_40_16]
MSMGILFVIATPIGNLKDITLRAIETLKEVNLIACEDTRQTIKLLNHYNIKKPLVSYHQHSKLTRIDYLIQELKNGKSIALVTDAGTPGISDPGTVLISQAIEAGTKVVPVPGASAVITALSASGLRTDEFVYLGFLPRKKGRKTMLESLAKEKRTIVFYESPYRVVKTLEELKIVLGEDRNIVIARELTKMFEEIIRGEIKDVILKLTPQNTRGEFVIIIEGKTNSGE